MFKFIKKSIIANRAEETILYEYERVWVEI